MKLTKVFLAALTVASLLTLGACSATAPLSKEAPSASAQAQGHSGEGAPSETAQGGAPTGAPGGGPGGGSGGARQTVQVTTINEGTLMGESTTSGTVEAVWQSKVPAQVSGTVAKILVKVGDWVKAGQTVVQLDTTQLGLTLADAQATLENAKLSLSTESASYSQETPALQYQLSSAQSAYNAAEKVYNSNEATYKLGGLSESDLDSAKATLDTAKAALETAKAALAANKDNNDAGVAKLKNEVTQAEIAVKQAQLNLNNASIKAPFEGQVASVSFQVGEYVASASTVYVLVSPTKQISFSIAPGDAAKITHGAQLTFAYDATSWPLSVTSSPSAPTDGLVAMTAIASKGTLPSLGVVGTVHYSLPLGTGAQVPISALQSKNNSNFVYTVEKGKIATRTVSVVAENGSVAVLKGLELPAQVVTSPPPGLVSGAEVKVLDTTKDGSS